MDRDSKTIAIGNMAVIDRSELSFSASRSAGPGGQNVNKLNTRVMLLFDVSASQNLTEPQKSRILKKLTTRINKQGILRLVSQSQRTQLANRQIAIERLVELLRDALTKRPPRRSTRPTYASQLRRFDRKKQRSALKRQRRTVDPESQ